MDASAIVTALERLVPGSGAAAVPSVDQPVVAVPAEHLLPVARALRDDPGLRFTALVDIVGVDREPARPRFELHYNLVAPDAPARVRLSVALDGDPPHAGSVTAVWPSAGFLEREVWDLFGVVFDGHPDLRRLLTANDWVGHPLRKDYPVQVDLPVKTYEPLQVTEEQFRQRIEHDRRIRGGRH